MSKRMTRRDLVRRVFDFRIAAVLAIAFGLLVWAIGPDDFSVGRMILASLAVLLGAWVISLVFLTARMAAEARRAGQSMRSSVVFGLLETGPAIVGGVVFWLLASFLTPIWRTIFALIACGVVGLLMTLVALGSAEQLGIVGNVSGNGDGVVRDS